MNTPGVIAQFYEAFQRLDAATMAACYHSKVVFEDPAFGRLVGEEACAMWRMLCESQQGKDFRVEASNLVETASGGSAHWEAYYTFSATRRRVHNIIDATFEIQEGKIIKHTDRFDLYRWARQAMGISGVLVGWTPFFKKQLQQKTRAMLERYQQRNNAN